MAETAHSLHRPLRVLLAGGGTAGHVNPLLATAAALRDPALGGDRRTQILVLGTSQGLEARLVPEAGLEMAVVPKVPMPRRPNVDLVRLPVRLRGAVAAARRAIDELGADVVVGFGGYVSTPAYVAARAAGIPVVIHEQNARPGLANRLGSRWAAAVAVTFASTPLHAPKGRREVTGLPLREVIADLARVRSIPDAAARQRSQAALELGLDPARPTVLVTGGSLGAQRLNEVMEEALGQLPETVQVLHLTGRGKDAQIRAAIDARGDDDLVRRYHVLDYLTAMDKAYAVADGVICRSGAGTVAELAALGIPALYVPLPVGNGEQRLNAADVIAAGGGRMVRDADFSVSDVLSFAQLIGDDDARSRMGQAAASTGARDGAARLAALIREVAGYRSDGRTASAPLSGRAFHLVGIGGAGMSVVAQLLVDEGARVSGSDAHDSDTVAALRAKGIPVHVGHDAHSVPPDATLVVSTAIKESNPELTCARGRGQEVIHRSQALALAAGSRSFVAVAGAHGKTTTSGMLAEALCQAGADPSFAVGGVVTALGTGAHVGKGDAFIAEADESDRSFLNYRPTIEVVTNVEPDHLDNYGSREAFEQAFLDFAHRLVPGGVLMSCSDDEGATRLARAAADAGCRVVTFGTASPGQAGTALEAGLIGQGHVQLRIDDSRPDGVSGTFQRWYSADSSQAPASQEPVPFELHLPGTHVALDAAGAWAAGCELGVDPLLMARSLGAFGGTKRRFEDRGEVDGVRVVDDYAHHPTEVAALLRTARSVANSRGGALRVLFQPHLFSRTQAFADRFAQALAAADEVVVTAIYPARETQEDFPGVSAELVIRGVGEKARYVADRLEAAHAMAREAHPGDLVLTVGAGDVTQLASVILDDLRSRAHAGESS